MSNPKVPAIPQPLPTMPGLVQVAAALKTGLEALAGVTGTRLTQAVVFGDLVRLGLVDQPTILSDTGRVSYASPGVLVQKNTTVVGDGTTTTFTVSHQLGTLDVLVDACAATTPFASLAMTAVQRLNTNQVSVTFQAAPPAKGARVTVIG